MSSLGVAPSGQPAFSVGRALTSINPLKRTSMKLKENHHHLLGDAALELSGAPALKRKQPLGNYVSSSANILASSSSSVSGRKELVVPHRTSRRALLACATDDPKAAAVSAVERRNARERNRVQQVNNGFAALRQRIPDEIAQAFEAGSHPPGSTTPATRSTSSHSASSSSSASAAHKKLSKVETLRMAVEYIKSLERLLALNDTTAAASSPTQDTQLPATPPPEPAPGLPGHPPDRGFFLALKPRTVIGPGAPVTSSTTVMVAPPSLPSLPPPTTPALAGRHQLKVPALAANNNSNNQSGHCFDQTQITIINGHQYMRIPGTNTYHYLDPESLYGEDVAMGRGGGGGGGATPVRSSPFHDDGDVALGAYDVDEDEEQEEEEYEDEEEEGFEELADGDDETLSSTGVELLSEHSPQSNFALDASPASGGGALTFPGQPDPPAVTDASIAPPGNGNGAVLDGAFDQQQYDELMLIKSELDEDDAELADDPAFLSWIEANQQLQLSLQHQLLHQLQQQQQQQQQQQCNPALLD